MKKCGVKDFGDVWYNWYLFPRLSDEETQTTIEMLGLLYDPRVSWRAICEFA